MTQFRVKAMLSSINLRRKRKRMNVSNFTLAFHTGMHLCFFTICCMTRPRIELKLRLLCEEKHQSWAKARKTQINEFKSLFWLWWGLFQKDLAHRFNVSETTVCTVFNTWVRFMSCFTVHSSGFSRGKIAPGTSSAFSFTFSCLFFSSPPPLWLIELF